MSDPIDIMAIAAVRHEQARAALLATGAMNAGPVAAMAGARVGRSCRGEWKHSAENLMQLFVDLDGVLADFDSGHEAAFGIRPCKRADNVDWKAVRAVPGFYESLPPMPDMHELWGHIERYRPIVLTGVPSSVEEAPANKRAWVRKHIGSHIEIRCCRSSEKCRHAAPGDVLIDDWDKYRSLWCAKGGLWITHKSAARTISALSAIGL